MKKVVTAVVICLFATLVLLCAQVYAEGADEAMQDAEANIDNKAVDDTIDDLSSGDKDNSQIKDDLDQQVDEQEIEKPEEWELEMLEEQKREQLEEQQLEKLEEQDN